MNRYLGLVLFLLGNLAISCQKQSGETNSTAIMNKEIKTETEEFAINETGSTLPDGAYTCNLSTAEMAERKEQIQKILLHKMTSLEELANGYRLHFPDDDGITESVFQFILLEKKCCSFFSFELTVAAFQKGTSLAITGNAITKHFIGHQLLDMGLKR